MERDTITGEADAKRFQRIVIDGEKSRKRREVIGRGGDRENPGLTCQNEQQTDRL